MISLNGMQWQGKRSEAVPAFDLSVMIRRPAAEVFALLADIQDAEPLRAGPPCGWRRTPPTPLRQAPAGTRLVRIAPGCWRQIENIVTEMEPPARLGIDFTTRWFGGHLTYEIETTQDGCILHHRETLRPRALLPWLPAVIAPRLRPHVAERLADIGAPWNPGA